MLFPFYSSIIDIFTGAFIVHFEKKTFTSRGFYLQNVEHPFRGVLRTFSNMYDGALSNIYDRAFQQKQLTTIAAIFSKKTPL